MRFILDASYAATWAFSDEETESRLQTLADLADNKATAVVPALWFYEIANILLVAERRKRITADVSERFVSLIQSLPLEAHYVSELQPEVLELGRKYNLSAYDAAYLHLAREEGLQLATLDSKLMAACLQSGQSLLPD